MVIWERFLVAVDVVALVDADDHELNRWEAGELFERLLLAGVPATHDPEGEGGTFGGRIHYVDLLVGAAQELVSVRVPGAETAATLRPEAAAIMLDWYRRHVDAC